MSDNPKKDLLGMERVKVTRRNYQVTILHGSGEGWYRGGRGVW